MRYVNVYEVDRVYGGPEEGGWWYDTGYPIVSIPTPPERVEEVVDATRTAYPRTGKRYSVLGGEDYEVEVEDHPARPWPEVRPHYE